MNSAERSVPSEESTPDRVRAELHAVIHSEVFERSPQLQRFLRYLVEETLAGRGERLKEYVIGTEVFGRPSDYDPQLDSLVRVEAHRLRAILDQYYGANTRRNGICIEIKKGSYVPVFRDAPRSAAEESVPARSSSVRLWFAVAAVVLVFGAAAWVYRSYLYQSRYRIAKEQTIALLPFDNLSSQPGTEYFCYGLVDEIATEVAKNEKLRVVAQTSASRFKRGDDIASIGQQLGADAVLEGSVQRSSDRLRVNVQLIRTSDRVQVWSETLERPSGDLFSVQDEVAQAVSSAVQSRLTGILVEASWQSPYSANPEANQLYWKGIYFRAPMGRTGWRKDLAVSAEFFERATEKDPRFAKAYAVLADVYVNLAWERAGGLVTQGYMERGRKAANRSLQLQDNLAEAYGALGTIQFFAITTKWRQREASNVRCSSIPAMAVRGCGTRWR